MKAKKAKITVEPWTRPDGKVYISVSRTYEGKASTRTHRMAIPVEDWNDFLNKVNSFQVQYTVITIPDDKDTSSDEG